MRSLWQFEIDRLDTTHIAVVTDYAQLEMLKGNALKNILKLTEILAEFPKQAHILKPITTVSGLKL
jgi:hypothetical protein